MSTTAQATIAMSSCRDYTDSKGIMGCKMMHFLGTRLEMQRDQRDVNILPDSMDWQRVLLDSHWFFGGLRKISEQIEQLMLLHTEWYLWESKNRSTKITFQYSNTFQYFPTFIVWQLPIFHFQLVFLPMFADRRTWWNAARTALLRWRRPRWLQRLAIRSALETSNSRSPVGSLAMSPAAGIPWDFSGRKKLDL